MDDFNSILGTFYLCVCAFSALLLGSDNAALIIGGIHLERIPAVKIHPVGLRDADGRDKTQVIIGRV